MFDSPVGSCDVVGIQDGLRIGGGTILRALACVPFGDRPSVVTHGSGMVGDCGHSTLGDGVSVASRFFCALVESWKRISYSF